MPRLPQPGGDNGNWGTILNDYLSAAHNPNGTLKPASVSAANIQNDSILESKLDQDVRDKLNTLAGQQGPTGPSGPTGATGPQGPAGVVGASGTQGATGPSGTPGTQGPSGASGAPGAQGSTGATGATGPSGAPSTIPGPTGPTGPAGPTGATGPQGTQGVPGASGASGAPGVQGATGPSGPSGPIGATGPAGTAGATGATGAAGVGVPAGGATGQLLAKASGTDFDTTWVATGGSPAIATSILQIDDFPGATDDAKHVAAWAAAAAASRKPILQYPARTFGPLSTPIAAFSGMRAIGPDHSGSDGPKNQEISSGNFVPHRVNVSCGTGTSSLFVQSSTIQEVVFANISYRGTSSSQWWHNTDGNSYSIYPGQFHSLAFDNFNSVLGNTADQFTCTQFIFSGHWTVLNFQNTPLHIGGSDNSLWMTGFINLNSPASVAGAGRPILHLDYLEKTNVGYVYITAENGWSGVRIEGPIKRNIQFHGGVFEGRSAGNPATYPVIDIRGGHTTFYGPNVGQVVNTNANGAIVQSGGVVELYSPHYYKATAAATTFPMFYQSGGVASIVRPFSGDGSDIRIRWKDAALGTQDEDIPYPTGNSRTAW